jgi:hypothetical protein
LPAEEVIPVTKPPSLPEEPIVVAKRSKQYLKIINSTIRAKRYGIASTIGNLTFSSVFNGFFRGREFPINSKYGWKASKNTTNEWVGLNFDNLTKIQQVRIQRSSVGVYPTELFVEYTKDNKTWTRVSTPLKLGREPVNPANFEISLIEVLSIRLVVTKYVGFPAFRFDFLFVDETCTQDEDRDQVVDTDVQAAYDTRVILFKRPTPATRGNFIPSFLIDRWEGVSADIIQYLKTINSSKTLTD